MLRGAVGLWVVAVLSCMVACNFDTNPAEDGMTPSRILGIALASVALMVAGAGQSRADDRLWANCRTCHSVTAPDGTTLARGGRSGPNLYGLAGRPLAGDSGFRLYSRDLIAAGASGRQWSEADFVAYLADPDQFLRAATGSADARSDMHVAMRQGGAALWTWLTGLGR